LLLPQKSAKGAKIRFRPSAFVYRHGHHDGGDLAGDNTRHFDGTAVTASLNARQSLATGGFSHQLEIFGSKLTLPDFRRKLTRHANQV
jgi:hypothetical protein